MSSHKVTLLALLAAAGMGVALACGPDFPTQVLDNRNAIVSPVSLSFPFEASRLVAKPADRLRVVEPDPSQYNQAPLAPEAVTKCVNEKPEDFASCFVLLWEKLVAFSARP